MIEIQAKAFYEQHCKPHVVGQLKYRHMNTVLDYLAIDVNTVYENDIKQHFVEIIERFVNVAWEKNELVEVI